ncbi:MAG TPA: ABC transporter permease [Ktedonobacterales bacterium]|nr:ABC transporter permease [Ktedonobacterales bacterium]
MSGADQDKVQLAKVHAAARRRLLLVNGLRLLILAVIVGGWEIGARTGIIDPFFWGQPSGIWAQLVTWVREGTAQGPLWEQIAVTLEEAVLGFIVGVTLGVIFGVALGTNRLLSDILAPYIKALNSIPRVALAPIFAIGLGLGLQSKVALATVLVFFIVFFNAFQGVREVDRNLLANARILGASRTRVATDVIIPSALTWIIASMHVSFSFALVGAVVGEFIGGIQGLGLMVQSAGANFNTNGVFAALLILAAVALTAEALVTALENRLITWRPNPAADVLNI